MEGDVTWQELKVVDNFIGFHIHGSGKPLFIRLSSIMAYYEYDTEDGVGVRIECRDGKAWEVKATCQSIKEVIERCGKLV